MTNLYAVFVPPNQTCRTLIRAASAEEAARHVVGAGNESNADVVLVATNIEPVELRPQYAAPPPKATQRRKGDA